MQAIHTIQTVTGPTLSIPVPPELQGKKVEVVISPVKEEQETPEQARARNMREAIMRKSQSSPRNWRQWPLFAEVDLLQGSVLGYEDPFGPACPPEDWEALS